MVELSPEEDEGVWVLGNPDSERSRGAEILRVIPILPVSRNMLLLGSTPISVGPGGLVVYCLYRNK